MQDKDLYQKTQKLIKQLHYFVIHVVVYFVVNIVLVLVSLRNFNSLWWMLFPILLWAIILIYHGLLIYREGGSGKDIQKALMMISLPFFPVRSGKEHPS